ncbi:hypothetical protein AB0N93_35290 [Streptomyces sp. NPDC091267]|uniref:hypothetical protein n=1 Tax=unclassified Streptomyces TaxID=2593676 RepID=UPI003437E339
MHGSFLYWSDRAIRRIAEDNGVELGPRPRWTASVNAGLVQAGLASPEQATRNRVEEAKRIEKALGTMVVSGLDAPPAALFVRATGRVNFAQFVGMYAKNPGALLHLRTRSGTGRQVDLCLFGSMDNVSGFGPWDDFENGWVSSEAPAIEHLLRGEGSASLNEDPEYLALEALKVALRQGSSGTDEEHVGRTETRGFTVGHNDDCTVLLKVYSDIVVDPARWCFRPDDVLATADRIIIGRPLYVRTLHPDATVRYPQMRRGTRTRSWWRPWTLRPRSEQRAIASTRAPLPSANDGAEYNRTPALAPIPPHQPHD